MLYSMVVCWSFLVTGWEKFKEIPCVREREREKRRDKLLEGIFISDYILIELMTQDN